MNDLKMITISNSDSKKAISLVVNSNKLINEVKIVYPNKIIISLKDLFTIEDIFERKFISYK